MISILVHNFNRASSLRVCLQSVQTQTHRPLEVLILDPGSTDGSAEVIANACARMQEVGISARAVSCEMAGVAKSRNIAASLANGDLVCFLDNDATFTSDSDVATIAAEFEANAALGALALKILRRNTAEIDITAWVFRRPAERWADQPFRTFTFAGGACCLRLSAFRAAGGFWSHLRYSREEEELALGLLDAGWEIRYAPHIVVRHYLDDRGRAAMVERRRMELRNGLLVLWRRFPLPVAVVLGAGRIGSMLVKAALRERTSPSRLLSAIREAWREWRSAGLRRCPVSYSSVFRYVKLHIAN